MKISEGLRSGRLLSQKPVWPREAGLALEPRAGAVPGPPSPQFAVHRLVVTQDTTSSAGGVTHTACPPLPEGRGRLCRRSPGPGGAPAMDRRHHASSSGTPGIPESVKFHNRPCLAFQAFLSPDYSKPSPCLHGLSESCRKARRIGRSSGF